MDRHLHIPAWRCPNGHLWLYAHNTCPDCGRGLAGIRIVSRATIVVHTVVRVNPTGLPISLGVARTTTGASTLCLIMGPIRGNGRDRVRLVRQNNRFYAYPDP